jgi:hypothetical protein
MTVAGWSFRTNKLWPLALIALAYAASLWWIHHAIRTPVNLDYFKQYVSLRCSAAHTEHVPRPRSRETLLELEKALERCQDIDVQVDGVWGGIYGRPSVRLKILYDDGTNTQFKYYSVDVSPLLGTASIRHELTSTFYYLNL